MSRKWNILILLLIPITMYGLYSTDSYRCRNEKEIAESLLADQREINRLLTEKEELEKELEELESEKEAASNTKNTYSYGNYNNVKIQNKKESEEDEKSEELIQNWITEIDEKIQELRQ